MISNTGSFTPYQYSGNSNGSFRKAGDYLADFTKQSGSNLGKVLGYQDKEDASTASNRSTSSGNSGSVNTSMSNNASPVNNNNAPQTPQVSKSSPAPQPQQAQSSGSSASGAPYKAAKQSAEKAAAYAAEQQQAKDNLANRASELSASYDPSKYQYYESDHGSGTGVDAYAKDMANYESWVAKNNSGGVGGGHLGLVAETMHPDWGRSQKTGGGNPIVEQDYSVPQQSYGGNTAKYDSIQSGKRDGYGSPYKK